uniref:hypothetical protein n=1 Tax=Streptomyces himalayensis TaxID=2820085 RepID=UPI0035E408CC
MAEPVRATWALPQANGVHASGEYPRWAMRDALADLITVKIGINFVTYELTRLRAFSPAVHGFLDTIPPGAPARSLA